MGLAPPGIGPGHPIHRSFFVQRNIIFRLRKNFSEKFLIVKKIQRVMEELFSRKSRICDSRASQTAQSHTVLCAAPLPLSAKRVGTNAVVLIYRVPLTQQLSETEREKLKDLSRMKRRATFALVVCLAILIAAKAFEKDYPFLAYVAAMAEAATIGGIADWYAVVALFRRPMGLPIPHTAIIPKNQHRIGDNLGRFIERNFLERETINTKLQEIDFAGEMAGWLSTPEKAQELSRFIAKLVPKLLDAVDQTGMRSFAAQRITSQLEKTEVAPIAARVLDSFVNDGRHQKLLNDLIAALHKFLNDERALETIREKVHEELPSLFNFFRADTLILQRLVKAGSALLDDVKKDPNHELRDEFEVFLQDYVKRIKKSKRFAKRAEKIKTDLLARPEIADIAQRLWNSLKTYLSEDVKKQDSTTVERLSAAFVDIGQTLSKETALREEINSEMVRILAGLIEHQKSGVATFISEQVKKWDFDQLTVLIEANIGRDLQFIRFNGMVIGGLAGLVLHMILVLLGYE